MKVVYTAGPYRDKRGPWFVRRNIEAAREIARELWTMGFSVICPHANTEMMDGTDTDHLFLEGDLEMLRRCDLVVTLPRWRTSIGATGEVREAIAREIPVLDWDTEQDAIRECASEMSVVV